MKLKKRLKRVVSTFLFICLSFNVYIPFAHALEQISRTTISDDAEWISLSELDIKDIIVHVIETAIACGKEYSLSEDLLTCYGYILQGSDYVPAKRLFNAFPELLEYTLQEKMLEKEYRAPRPDAPGLLTPAGQVVGSNSGCNFTQVLNALSAVKSQIGTVRDSSCKNTILGILGDACECLGEEQTISCFLAELVASFTSTIMISDDLINTLTECCADLEEDFRETWTIINEIKETVTECCEALKEDFRQTWTIIAGIKETATECCEELKKDFRETWTILEGFEDSFCKDFQETWTIIAGFESSFTQCCEDLQEDFRETWTILANFQEQVCKKFEGTWTQLDEIKETVTECCSLLEKDFQETWTILQTFEENTCKKFEGTWTALNDLDITVTFPGALEKFQQTWTALEENTQVYCDLFEQTWTALEGFEDTICEKFNGTFTQLNTIEQLIQIITTSQIQSFVLTASKINMFIKDILDTTTEIAQLSIIINENLEELQEVLCDKFEQTWTILDTGFNDTFTGIKNLQDTTCDKFIETWTIIDALSFGPEFEETFTVIAGINCDLDRKFEETFTITNAGFTQTFTALGTMENILCDKFEQTFTIFDAFTPIDLRQIFTAIQEVQDTFCDKFVATWTQLADLNQTITQCCQELERNFRETWTILQEIENKLPCTFSIRQSDIPLTITEPGLYCVVESISSSDATIIDVQSDDVVIDLQGNIISGDGSNTAINIDGQSNLGIKNGSMENLNIGIDGASINSVIISSLSIDAGRPILLSNSENIFINDSTGYFSTFGVSLLNEIRNCQLENCALYSNGGFAGINIDNASSNSENICLKNCTTFNATSNGILVRSNISIDGNLIIDSCKVKESRTGISVSRIDNFIIENCTSIGGSGDGFNLNISSGEVRSNEAIGNVGVGFNNLSGTDIIFYNNTSYNNGTNYSGVSTSLIRNPNRRTGYFTNVDPNIAQDPLCSCTQEFAETWTAIEESITSLCEKFNGTWTLLDSLDDTTFILSLTGEEFTGVFTALEQLNDDTCDKFEQTWTIIQPIVDEFVGPQTVIRQSDIPFTISSAGSYILAESVTFDGSVDSIAIDIQATNVNLDLNGHTISDTSAAGSPFPSGSGTAISVQTQSDVQIKNGKIMRSNVGIQCDQAQYVCIENISTSTVSSSLVFTSCTDSAIKDLKSLFANQAIFFSGSDRISIQNVFCSCLDVGVLTFPAIQLTSSNDLCFMHGNIFDANADGFFTSSCSNVTCNSFCIEGSRSSGFLINGSTNISFRNCSSFANVSSGFEAGSTANNNIAYVNCNSENNQVHGYFFQNGTGLGVCDCSAIVNGDSGFTDVGFSRAVFIDCEAINNQTIGFDTGLFLSTVLYKRCEAVNNGTEGFRIPALSSTTNAIQILDCNAIDNGSDGFDIAGNENLLRNNSAVNNGGFGFNNTGGAANRFFTNVASGHVTGFSGVTMAPVLTGLGAITGGFGNKSDT